MSEPSITRPSETPALAHRAFVDSKRRCPYCSKRMVEEVRNNAEGVPNLVTTCLNCDEWTTWSHE